MNRGDDSVSRTGRVATGGLPVPGNWRDPIEAGVFMVPRCPKGVVPRARLEERLNEGVRGPLTLVTAPAGTGKTVLVSSWVSRLDTTSTVVWLSLDEATTGPGTFWYLVVTGLARQGVDVPHVVSPGPDAGDPSFTSSIAEQVLAHHEPVVLVLDCDGLLASDTAARLDSLIRRSAGRLRVVLLTREDPLLPLHRYRLAGTLLEVRMVDLAFTPDEARQMLTGMGVDLSAGAMDAMIRRTQGWAAGLRMAAMSLAHREDGEAAAWKLAGDSGTVAEYLLAEVLDTQPKALRQLLLDTSVVDVLRPGLAAALAGPHADRALSFLVHGNAFLEELRDFPGCYRYHHLFRELLRAQLAYESPARSVELHRVAAAWLADHGRVVDAVRHAVTIAEWETAARYAVDDLCIFSLLTGRSAEGLQEVLARIPKSAQGSAVSIVCAARAVATGDWKGAAGALTRARQLLPGTREDSWPEGELSIAVVQLVHARQTAAAETALDAGAVAHGLIHVQQPARLAAHPELAAVIQSNLGGALVLAGRLNAAGEAFAAAAAAGNVTGRELPLIDALGHGALLAAWRGDLTRAAGLAVRAIRVSSAAGLTPVGCPAAAEIALAYVHTERYDLGAGRKHALRAAGCVPAPYDPLSTAMLGLVQARICRAAGDPEGALASLDAAGAGGRLPGWLADSLGLEKIAMLVADGQSADAEAVVEQLTEQYAVEAGLRLTREAPGGSVDLDPPALSLRGHGAPIAVRVDTVVQSAIRHARAGSEKNAVRDLDHALRLAAPEQSRRPFRAAPKDLWRLLGQHNELLLRHPWLTDRRTGGPEGGGVPPPRLPMQARQEPDRFYQPLTDKERAVLGHLSELLTTEEIAASMLISVNTVRTHVRNILRKLAASRRNEAVRRARVLNLIPPLAAVGEATPPE
jgi:LuxR family maltose regulon positive regulatory protein